MSAPNYDLSQLEQVSPAKLPLTGNELLYAVQNGADVVTTAQQLSAVGGVTVSQPSVYNVKNFGATGNGTTDDTAACQAAATAASGTSNASNGIGTNGGVLYFPQNSSGNATYLLSSALTDSGYGVAGISCDPGVTLTVPFAGPNLLINFTNCQAINGFITGGLYVHGKAGGIYLSNSAGDVDNWVFQNFSFFQPYGSPTTGDWSMQINVPILCTFINLRFLYSANGLLLLGGTSCHVINCYGLQNYGVSFGVDGTNYSTFTACASDKSGVGYRTWNQSQGISYVSCGHEVGTATNLTVTNSQISGSTATITYSGESISSQFINGMPVAVSVGTNTNCNGRWYVSGITPNTITFSLGSSPGDVNSVDTGTISINLGDGFQFLNSYNCVAQNCLSETPQQATSSHYCLVNSQYSGFNYCRGVTGTPATAQTYDIDIGHGNSNIILNQNYVQTATNGTNLSSTGWGTPTGTNKTTNFPGAGATLTQTSETLAALIQALLAAPSPPIGS